MCFSDIIQITEWSSSKCGQCQSLISLRFFLALIFKFYQLAQTPHFLQDIVRALSPLDSTTKKTPRCKNTKGGDIYTVLQPRISQKLVKAIWPVLNPSFQSLSCIHIFPHSYGTASKLLYDVSILYWSRILAGIKISSIPSFGIPVFLCF